MHVVMPSSVAFRRSPWCARAVDHVKAKKVIKQYIDFAGVGAPTFDEREPHFDDVAGTATLTVSHDGDPSNAVVVQLTALPSFPGCFGLAVAGEPVTFDDEPFAIDPDVLFVPTYGIAFRDALVFGSLRKK